MDLDAVEAGRECVRRATLEVVDDVRNFRKFECAGLRDVDELAADKSLALGADRAGRDRLAAAGLQ